MTTMDRYSRLEKIEWWNRKSVAEARALVAGGGALGNEVIKNLLLLGWGKILVVDFDHVELSNLSRSILFNENDIGKNKAKAIAESAKKINPDCEVTGIEGDIQFVISAGIVNRMDVVFGCLDNIRARLTLNGLTGQSNCLYIDGGLMTWEGTITLFHGIKDSCYACGLTNEDFREINLRRSCPAYDIEASKFEGVPTTPTISSIIGAYMVQEALKWIHKGKNAPDSILGSQIRIDILHNRFWKCKQPRNNDCRLHPVHIDLYDDHILRIDDSWDIILKFWKDLFPSQNLIIHLPVSFIESIECPHCGKSKKIFKIFLSENESKCQKCNVDLIPNLINQISGKEDWLKITPLDMGFSVWTWLTLQKSDGEEIVFELQGCSERFDNIVKSL